jgi:hypothetical protein
MQKFFLSASLAGLLLLAGCPICTHATLAQSQPAQQAKVTKTITGKIASIGSDGHSFGLEVDQGGGKQTMQFIVDKNAKIRGKVTVGSPVTVEYAIEQGQNLALTISGQA